MSLNKRPFPILFITNFSNILNKFVIFVTATNHKHIAISYFVFGIRSGIIRTAISIYIRWTLTVPRSSIVTPELYNFLVTAHRLVIIFFFLIPVLIRRFGNYLLPLYLQVPDIAMPRLNNISFWLLPPSFRFFTLSLTSAVAPSCRWTIYPPLSSWMGSPRFRIDYLILSLHLARISSIIRSINFLVTIIDSSEIRKSNLFPSAIAVTSLLLVLSLPVLAGAITILLLDRNFNTCFFDPVGGRDPVLFQHLFWFFRHPEVYVLILPRIRLVSNIITHITRYRLEAYRSMFYALWRIGILRFIVWAHHMFTSRLDTDTRAYFTSATLIIAIPTGIKAFTWVIAYIQSPKYVDTNTLWSLGFVFLFTLRGITRVALANSSLDLVLHDTYFVVAHFHYVLSIRAVFSAIGAFLFYCPLFFRASPNEYYSQVQFWVFFVRVNLTFFPQHFLRASRIPRRYCDYTQRFASYHVISTLRSLISALRLVIYFLLLADCYTRRQATVASLHTYETASLKVYVHQR